MGGSSVDKTAEYRATHREYYREANKQYRAENPEMLKARKMRAKNFRRDFLNRWKLAAGCVDCGYAEHAVALDFDHLDPTTKLFSLGSHGSCSMDKIINEIAKCVVRCANCHRVKTHG